MKWFSLVPDVLVSSIRSQQTPFFCCSPSFFFWSFSCPSTFSQDIHPKKTPMTSMPRTGSGSTSTLKSFLPGYMRSCDIWVLGMSWNNRSIGNVLMSMRYVSHPSSSSSSSSSSSTSTSTSTSSKGLYFTPNLAPCIPRSCHVEDRGVTSLPARRCTSTETSCALDALELRNKIRGQGSRSHETWFANVDTMNDTIYV